jgi:ADP-heptose:LPS heptosyltransferase
MARMAGAAPYRPYWREDEPEQAYGEQMWTRLALNSNRPKVGLHLHGNAWEGKNWPPEKMQELVDAVRAEGCEAILLGAGFMPRVDGAVNLVNRTNIRQLGALLSRCDVVVSSDSGPMHIAAALGVPTVTPYGPTDPNVSSPYKAQHYPILSGAPCAPCFEVHCPRGHCVCSQEIPTATVMKYVTQVLAEDSRPLRAASQRR